MIQFYLYFDVGRTFINVARHGYKWIQDGYERQIKEDYEKGGLFLPWLFLYFTISWERILSK